MTLIQLTRPGNLSGSNFDEIVSGSGLIGYWALNNNINDSTMNNNVGTLTHGSVIYAHYIFNNNGSDSSIYANDLTNTSLTFGPGKIGSAAYFNGTTSYAEKTATIGVTSRSPQTITAWVKPDNLTNQNTITSYNGSAGFSIKTTGVLEIDLQGSNSANTGGGQIRTGSTIPTGTWTHVAVAIANNLPTNQSVDIRNADFYINGSLTAKTLTAATNDATAAAVGIRIGAKTSNTNLFAGSIDDVRVYATLLNSEQIGSLYNNGVGMETELTDSVYVPGRFGSAMFFPMNSLLNLNNPSVLQFGSPNDFTFSLWAYPYTSGNGTAMGLFCRSFIAGLDIGGVSGSAGTFRFGVRLGGTVVLSTSPTYSFGSWYHVVGVHDATAKTVQVYVNGSAHTAASFSTLNWVNGTVLSIAGTSVLSGNSTAYNGIIDDVRVYSRVLGSAEIKAMALNQPYFTNTSGVFSKEFREAQSLSGSVKMRMNNNNSIYISGELVEN